MLVMEILMPNGSPGKVSNSARACQTGFAYVLLLISVAVIGIAASASVNLGSQMARRDTEQSLLAIGNEFEQALRSYAGVPMDAVLDSNANVGLGARGPRTLEDLLKDPRSANTRRHLRQIYADPMTGRAQWGLVKDPSGFIVGMYSLDDGKPIKQTGFASKWAHFEGAVDYSVWVFGLPSAQLKNTTILSSIHRQFSVWRMRRFCRVRLRVVSL